MSIRARLRATRKKEPTRRNVYRVHHNLGLKYNFFPLPDNPLLGPLVDGVVMCGEGRERDSGEEGHIRILYTRMIKKAEAHNEYEQAQLTN